MKNLFVLILMLVSATAFGREADEMGVQQVLKGDAVVAANYKQQGFIVHLAGVDCPELNQPGGRAALQYMSQMTRGQKVMVTTYVSSGTHLLAKIETENGVAKDIGAEMLRAGLCWYRNQEADNLDAIQQSSYKVLADQAKYAKKGIWKNGDIFVGNINPDSWRTLGVGEMQSPYIQNGAGGVATAPVGDARTNSFGRDQVSGIHTYGNHNPAQQPQQKDPGDWRKKIYKDN